MKPEQFSELFDNFAANNWSFLMRDMLPETKKLYFSFFNKEDYEVLKQTFNNLIKSQKMMPSIATVKAEIDAVRFNMPQPKFVAPNIPKSRRDRIKQMIGQAREIIKEDKPDKMQKLAECGMAFLKDRKANEKSIAEYKSYCWKFKLNI